MLCLWWKNPRVSGVFPSQDFLRFRKEAPIRWKAGYLRRRPFQNLSLQSKSGNQWDSHPLRPMPQAVWGQVQATRWKEVRETNTDSGIVSKASDRQGLQCRGMSTLLLRWFCRCTLQCRPSHKSIAPACHPLAHALCNHLTRPLHKIVSYWSAGDFILATSVLHRTSETWYYIGGCWIVCTTSITKWA